MKKKLFIVAFVILFAAIPWIILAQQNESLRVSYLVKEINTDSTTTTSTLEVIVATTIPSVLNEITLKLYVPIGNDTEIQGQIAFAAIEPGQVQVGTGVFSAPREYFDGEALDSLHWEITYTDEQGQIQTEIIAGFKQ
jgi:hypothetical protein